MAIGSVCFFANWERTESWIATGMELARRGFRVFLVVTAREYYDMALAAGMASENVLWIRKDHAPTHILKPGTQNLLEEYERKSGFRIKQFLLMDRFLREWPQEQQITYMLYVFEKVQEFVSKNEIDICSGEPSDTHSLLSLMIARAEGRQFAAPFNIRFPVLRVAFWDSEVEMTPQIIGAPTPNDVSAERIAEATEIRNKILGRELMPGVAAKMKGPPFNLAFIKKLTRGVIYRALVRSKHDGHMYTLSDMIFRHQYHMFPIRYRVNKKLRDKLFEKPVEGEKYVLYTLNYQPEHSVDVTTPDYMNALENVKMLARSLPFGVKLYVKEHPNALGIRGALYLLKIKQVPGVRLIDPMVSSHDVLKKALLTISLGGTISLEAAMYGARTAIPQSNFIEKFSIVEKIKHFSEVADLLKKEMPAMDVEADIRVIAWILDNSLPGTAADRISDPENALSVKNISVLADGYEKILARIHSNH